MKFQKGQSKPAGSGRKAGVPNKRKLQKASELLAEADLHPIQAVVDLIRLGDMRDKERADLWMQLFSYCEAKPKESDGGTGDGDESPLESLGEEDLLKLVKSNGVS